MMKRYINMPLKYALPLFFIGLLVLVSIRVALTTLPTLVQARLPAALPQRRAQRQA